MSSYWVYRVFEAILLPGQKRLIQIAKNLDEQDSIEVFMKRMKEEVDFLARMVTTMDVLEESDTRLLVIVDGLNSCEQDKILDVLDQVNVLFKQSPFISILTIDHVLIVKAVDEHISKAFKKSSISGREYLKNIIQLPMYLTAKDPEYMKKMNKLRKSSTTQIQKFSDLLKKFEQEKADNELLEAEKNRTNSSFISSSLTKRNTTVGFKPTKRISISNIRIRQALDSSNSENKKSPSKIFDFNETLGKNEWYRAMSPQQMKRQLNIISLTSRLVRSNSTGRIEWERLAAWTHLVETWPYRATWLVIWVEDNVDTLDDKEPLASILQTLLPFMPSSSEHGEKLLAIDEEDARSLQVFLECRQPILTAGDVKKFLPLTINLDPQLKHDITDVQDAMASSPMFVNAMNSGVHPYLQ